MDKVSPEERLSTMSGVSKRLFVALSDLRGEPAQLEDALFQMASVIDATSKHHFPNERFSKSRFVAYLDSVATEIFKIAYSGKITIIDCSFTGTDGNQHSFGEIIYGIRCSSYHDPNEVDALIYWGEENTLGVNNGRFIITRPILMALFLILISDEANENYIDKSLFTDDHYLTFDRSHFPFHLFVGNRNYIFEVLGLERQ